MGKEQDKWFKSGQTGGKKPPKAGFVETITDTLFGTNYHDSAKKNDRAHKAGQEQRKKNK